MLLRRKFASLVPVIASNDSSPKKRVNVKSDVVFVGCDGSRTGASIFLLQLLRWFRANTSLRFVLILQYDGPLVAEFRSVCSTLVLNSEVTRFGKTAERFLSLPGLRRIVPIIQGLRIKIAMRLWQPSVIYANTAVVGEVVGLANIHNVPVIAHIHELESTMTLHKGARNFATIKSFAVQYIAASRAVLKNLVDLHDVPESQIVVVHEFIPTASYQIASESAAEVAKSIRKAIGIPKDGFVVCAVGALNWRKAPDVLVQVARVVLKLRTSRPIWFLWIGAPAEPDIVPRLMHDIQALNIQDRFLLLPAQSNMQAYLAAIDVLAMTSREDPYPLVVLEAAAAGKPTLCFAGAGGAPEFVEQDCGFVVDYLDIEAMARRIVELCDRTDMAESLGDTARRKVVTQHDIDGNAPRIFEIIANWVGPSR